MGENVVDVVDDVRREIFSLEHPKLRSLSEAAMDHVHGYREVAGQSVPECECGAVAEYEPEPDWWKERVDREKAAAYDEGYRDGQADMLERSNADSRELVRVVKERMR